MTPDSSRAVVLVISSARNSYIIVISINNKSNPHLSIMTPDSRKAVGFVLLEKS